MKTVFRVGKGIVLVCLLVFVFFTFRVPSDSAADFDSVLAAVQKDIPVSHMVRQDNQSIRRFLGIDPEAYEQIAYFKEDDVMQANEYVLVKFKDHSQQKGFEDAMEQRIDDQINVYEGYAPEQVQLLDNAKINIQANYAFYVVDNSADELEKQFVAGL